MAVKLEVQGEKVLSDQESCDSVSDQAEDVIGISQEVILFWPVVTCKTVKYSKCHRTLSSIRI